MNRLLYILFFLTLSTSAFCQQQHINVIGQKLYAYQEEVVGDTVQTGIIGNVFSDNFARSSLGGNYTSATPSTTLSFSSSSYMGVTVSTAGTFNNYIERTYVTGLNLHTDSVVFVIGSPSATTYGVGIGMFSHNTFYTRGYVAQFSYATGSSGQILFYTDSGTSYTQQATSATSIAGITSGDTLVGTATRTDSSIIMTYRDRRTNTSVGLTYVYPATILSGTTQLSNTGNLRMYFLGGTYNVAGWTVYTPQHTGGVLWMGNSIMSGYNATSWNQRYLSLLYPYNRQLYDVIGGPGDKSIEGVEKSAEILLHAPRVLFIALGVNDRSAGVTATGAYQTNIDSIIRLCIANGIRPVLVGNAPQNAGSIVAYNTVLQTEATTYNIPYIDIYDPLNLGNGTSYAAIYNSGDGGIHPNSAGHAVIASTILASVPQIVNNSPLSAANLKNIVDSNQRQVYFNPATGLFGVAQTRVKDSTKYIFASPATAQNANISLSNTSTISTGTQLSAYPISLSNTYTNFPTFGLQNLANQGYDGFVAYDNNGVARGTFAYANEGMGQDSGNFIIRSFTPSRNSAIYLDGGNQSIAIKHTVKVMYDSISILQPINFRALSSFTAPTTSSSGINLAAGTAATSPNQGDLMPVLGHLYYRDQSTTYDLLTAGTNIYNTNGTLTGNRTLTLGGNTLAFSGLVGPPSTYAAIVHSTASDSGTYQVPLAYGTYTPTLTNTTNITSSTVNQAATYTRIGNIVHVNIACIITPTTASTATVLTFTLPFTTSNGSPVNIGSAALDINSGGVGTYTSGIVSLASTTTATLSFNCTSLAGSSNVNIQFDYSL